MKKCIVYSDGGARGNPGPAAIGVVVMDEVGNILKQISQTIGIGTNNQAEYKAIQAGLIAAKELSCEEVTCFLDSELVVNQLKLNYKVKDKELALLFVKVWNLAQEFKKITFNHVPREKNAKADLLVNQALDKDE